MASDRLSWRAMRVLLVNPPEVPGYLSDRDKAGGLGTMFPMRRRHGPVVPPLDLLYSAAACRERGAEVRIFDAPAQKDKLESVRDAVEDFEPDWVGVRLSLPSLREDLELARGLGSEGQRVAVFGNVALTTGDRWHESLPATVLFGEPEALWPALLEGAEHPAIWAPGQSRPSLWHLVEDLEALPHPAWDLLDLSRYAPSGDVADVVFYLLTSRGCPRACSMCPYFVHQGAQWRARGVSSVLVELAELRALGARRIQVRDPNFGLDRRRLRALATELARADLGLDLRAETDLELLGDDSLEILASAGIRTLMTGIESADPDCLADIHQTEAAFRKNLRNIDRCAQLGIEVVGFLVVGAAAESHASVRRTVEIARKLPIRYSVSLMTPYPGTVFTQEALEAGRTRLSDDYHKMGGTRSLLATRFMTSEEVARAHRWADRTLRLATARRTLAKSSGRAALRTLLTYLRQTLAAWAAALAFARDARRAGRRP